MVIGFVFEIVSLAIIICLRLLSKVKCRNVAACHTYLTHAVIRKKVGKGGKRKPSKNMKNQLGVLIHFDNNSSLPTHPKKETLIRIDIDELSLQASTARLHRCDVNYDVSSTYKNLGAFHARLRAMAGW